MATTPTHGPQALEGRVLLGWMDKDVAVRYLTPNCMFDPPITAEEAEAIWRPYRDHCEALPEREALAPARLPLSHEERQHATQFMAALSRMGPHNIQEIVKVDLSRVVVHQLY